MKYQIENKYHRSFIGFMEHNSNGEWCKTKEAESLIERLDSNLMLSKKHILKMVDINHKVYLKNTILSLIVGVESVLLVTFILLNIFS